MKTTYFYWNSVLRFVTKIHTDVISSVRRGGKRLENGRSANFYLSLARRFLPFNVYNVKNVRREVDLSELITLDNRKNKFQRAT